MIDQVALKREIKRRFKSVRAAAAAAHVAYETMRNYVYKGVDPSLETTCNIAAVVGEVRYVGRFGTAVIRVEERVEPSQAGPVRREVA